MVTRTGSLSRALAASLRVASLLDQDAAGVALAKRYAALIDEAAPERRYAEWLRTVAAGLDPANERAAEALERIMAVLGQHSVASDLGPKLLATLAALGLTPAGRGAKGGGSGVPVVGKLDELRQRRARKGRAKDLDASGS